MEVIKLLLSFRSVAECNAELQDLKSRRENSCSLNSLGLGPHGCHGKDVLWTLVGKSFLHPLGSLPIGWCELKMPMSEVSSAGEGICWVSSMGHCNPACPFLIGGSMCQRCSLAWSLKPASIKPLKRPGAVCYLSSPGWRFCHSFKLMLSTLPFLLSQHPQCCHPQTNTESIKQVCFSSPKEEKN